MELERKATAAALNAGYLRKAVTALEFWD